MRIRVVKRRQNDDNHEKAHTPSVTRLILTRRRTTGDAGRHRADAANARAQNERLNRPRRVDAPTHAARARVGAARTRRPRRTLPRQHRGCDELSRVFALAVARMRGGRLGGVLE